MAQQESELLCALLGGKVKSSVDSLGAAFAQTGSWVAAPGDSVAQDLRRVQMLVRKGIEALSL